MLSWFHSGDLASVDADGYFSIIGRKKDPMIKRSGKNSSRSRSRTQSRRSALCSHTSWRSAIAACDAPTEAELAALASCAEHRATGTSQSKQQPTRRQTLGYGLLDSPAAQCAWIVEKFQAWTDCGGHSENILTYDELLDKVMLYWLPGAHASSARRYWESFGNRPLGRSTSPQACRSSPGRSSRFAPLGEQRFTDLYHYNELPRGGYFAAFEQPELFVDAVRTFCRQVR